MANSLRAKISKLRHDRNITEEEYQEMISKLDGHDKQIRADAIDECIKILTDDCKCEFVELNCFECMAVKIEQLKENSNG